MRLETREQTMAMLEGPAGENRELSGPPPAADESGTEAKEKSEVPKISVERVQQELARLAGLIQDNDSLRFLEPRVTKCQETGETDLVALLSFYRLVSQSLSEELVNQKVKLKETEAQAAQSKSSDMKMQLEEAFHQASQAVQQKVNPTPSAPAPSSSYAGGGDHEELKQKLDASEKQLERLMVDMQNIRNRAKIDLDVKVFQAIEKFTQSLLPALDAFHVAMRSLHTATDTTAVVTGVEMIYESLQDALTKAGLQKIESVGQPFDPRYHEAIGEVETEDVPDEHVYDELQPGYLFGEKLVRAPMVRIARNRSKPPEPATAAPATAAPSAPPPPPVQEPQGSPSGAAPPTAPPAAASPAQPVASPPPPAADP